MASQRFWCLAFMPTWIFLLSSVRSEMDAPKIYLNSTVFVACMGGNVSIEYKLKRPANQTEDKLTCYDPSNNTVYDDHTAGQQDYVEDTFVLKNLKNISGEYYCQYKTAKVYWFLRVIDGSYKETMMWDYTRLILIAIFTGVLFVFSAVGSMYVITGHWITECGNSGKKQMQKREEKTEGKLEEDHVNAVTDSSTSFYASLEARPRSIYDVLDNSAANREPDQSNDAIKTNETPQVTVQTTQQQGEGVFESVYENF